MIFLDANAGEPPRPEALAAAMEAAALPGNPASIHAAGRAARNVLERARRQVAASVGVAPQDLVFCSGGTEANATGIAAFGAGRRVLVGATEHDAVRAAAAACVPAPAILPVAQDGRIDLDHLARCLAAGAPALVCLMLANNETGVLHPVEEIAALCGQAGARLHIDASQAAGRWPIAMASLGADSLALSGHKLGGIKGAGALALRRGSALDPLIGGGGQERGRRGGTPALAAIAAMGAAAAACAADATYATRLSALRDTLEGEAAALGAWAIGRGSPRLPNTACLALAGVPAETQVMALDLAGVCVSAGAACSSGKVTSSHVLRAMGLDTLAGCAIRVSLPWNAQEQDVRAFLGAYAEMARRLSPASAAPISAA